VKHGLLLVINTAAAAVIPSCRNYYSYDIANLSFFFVPLPLMRFPMLGKLHQQQVLRCAQSLALLPCHSCKLIHSPARLKLDGCL
jgi:hypothetical protein